MERVQERTRPIGKPRRAVTDPIVGQKAKHARTPEAVETLYVHHDAKIVSFSVSGSSRISESLGDGSPAADTSLLPWSSPLERTIAVGELIRDLSPSKRRRTNQLTGLTSRAVSHISCARFRRFYKLRLCPSAYPTQEPVLVRRQKQSHFRAANTKAILLEDRALPVPMQRGC